MGARRAGLLAAMMMWGCGSPTVHPTADSPSTDVNPASEGNTDAGGADSVAGGGAWWKDAVFYEIFVRSFYDSDGDGIGDFRGLTAKLDVLNDGKPGGDDLGVTGLWLMPINASPSYHGYDVTDYRAVNPEYGTMADFDALLAAAHQRGIKVIIDLVLNHSSSQHPWFKAARRDKTSPKRTWYTFRDTAPEGWGRPWDQGNVWHKAEDSVFYGLFWDGMPDLNLKNPEVEAELLDVMRFWLARGVDGFRLDAVRHLFETEDGTLADVPDNHVFLKRVRKVIGVEFPDAVLVGEAWSSVEDQASYYGAANELHMTFSFGMSGALRTAVKDGVKSDLNQMLAKSDAAFSDRNFEAPFLTNHDMARVMRDLGGAEPLTGGKRMRLAAALLFASPGTPFVYYGEEIGMTGGAGGQDEQKRTPMRWDCDATVGFTTGDAWFTIPAEVPGTDLAAQRSRRGSLWTLYQQLIALRTGHPALSRGTQRIAQVTGGDRGVTAFLREYAGQRMLVVVNVAPTAAAPFSVDVTGSPSVRFSEGFDGAPTREGAALKFAGAAPRAFAFVELE